MDYNKTAGLLKTSRPLEIFKKIVGFNEQAQSLLEMGRIRIGLASGFTLEGTPVKIDADSNAVFISENNSISYVNAASLAGIEVLNPELLMEVLADGTYIKVPSGEPRTMLQLKRTFKAQTDSMAEKYGINFQTTLFETGLATELEKYQFEQFLQLFHGVLGAIELDDMGKAAILELEELSLKEASDAISVAKIERHMMVGINFKTKFSIDFKDKLKTPLESNL